MNSSHSADTHADAALNRADANANAIANANAVLAREAGVPFAPVPDSTTPIDPFVEWLSLMEVVEMLCPVWPVREHPMRGEKWRL